MSVLTQLRSAQVSEGLSFAQCAGIGSSSRDVPSRPFSRALLDSFNINTSPTPRELYELQIELDFQCLQLAANVDDFSTEYKNPDVNSVVEVAVYLSGPLCLAKHSGTFQYQDLQLRALVSCLALLHYHGVNALYPEQWDRLRRTDISEKLAFQLRSNSKLSERIRYAPNVYLVQLTSRYLSFMRRGDSNLPSVVGPIAKMFWGSVVVVSE